MSYDEQVVESFILPRSDSDSPFRCERCGGPVGVQMIEGGAVRLFCKACNVGVVYVVREARDGAH